MNMNARINKISRKRNSWFLCYTTTEWLVKHFEEIHQFINWHKVVRNCTNEFFKNYMYNFLSGNKARKAKINILKSKYLLLLWNQKCSFFTYSDKVIIKPLVKSYIWLKPEIETVILIFNLHPFFAFLECFS